jgi:GT2 family glycosyltransferase
MKLTIVVVFYKQKIAESKTFSTFMKAMKGRKTNGMDLILYDNSPDEQHFNPEDYPEWQVTYIHDPRNLGIATAYNFALASANGTGSDWLLLFDHDTEVTEQYAAEFLHEPQVNETIAAVVPKINSAGTMISPVYSHSLRPLTEERPLPGVQETPVMAINSGSLLRVGFLNEIGGFNEEFPLDYLDHWLFYEIYARDKNVLLVDVALEHELSVMDYSNVSLRRYQSILDAEMKFYSEYKKDLSGPYKKQLCKRLLKQILLVKNKQIALYTLRRLFK